MRKDFLPFHVPDIADDEIQSVVETLRSGWLTTGPKVKQFWGGVCEVYRRSANLQAGEESRIKIAYTRRKRTVPEDRYSYFNRGNLFIVQERERWLLALLDQYSFSPLIDKDILEVGCGTGYWLREFIKWGAQPENVAGIDLSDILIYTEYQ